MPDAYASRFVTAPDGLRLHVRDYGPRLGTDPAVVCLPGLARTSADFDTLARALALEPQGGRRIIAIDYRGRGLSDYDRKTSNYSFAVELADILAVLTALGIDRAVFMGTSRGGILAMLLAAVRPTVIAGVVLNDIGPVIEARGLARIKSYLGKLPQPKSFEDGAELLSRLFGTQFPKLSPEDWLAFGHRTFQDKKGRLVATYDVKLAKTLKGIDLERALPPLWREFDALAGARLMVIRGGNSDVLSSATVDAMRARRPDLESLEVPDQGHAPLLMEPETIRPIAAFVAACR